MNVFLFFVFFVPFVVPLCTLGASLIALTHLLGKLSHRMAGMWTHPAPSSLAR